MYIFQHHGSHLAFRDSTRLNFAESTWGCICFLVIPTGIDFFFRESSNWRIIFSAFPIATFDCCSLSDSSNWTNIAIYMNHNGHWDLADLTWKLLGSHLKHCKHGQWPKPHPMVRLVFGYFGCYPMDIQLLYAGSARVCRQGEVDGWGDSCAAGYGAPSR